MIIYTIRITTTPKSIFKIHENDVEELKIKTNSEKTAWETLWINIWRAWIDRVQVLTHGCTFIWVSKKESKCTFICTYLLVLFYTNTCYLFSLKMVEYIFVHTISCVRIKTITLDKYVYEIGKQEEKWVLKRDCIRWYYEFRTEKSCSNTENNLIP